MNKVTSAAIGVVAAIGAVGIMPGLAQAVNGCEPNRVCIFDENNFLDRMGMRPAGEGRKDVSAANNDRTDSWKNNTGTNAAWYYNFTYENADNCRNMPAHDQDSNLGVFNSDELSSWRTNRGC
jgi:hypothetical protein